MPTPLDTGAGSLTSDGGDGGGPAALPASCHEQGGLPDPSCTPGATNPSVTQANVGSTICTRGFTTTVRPPVTYTDPLKREIMRRYGDPGSAADYELDHLVPLELGGAPRSVHNLWPQPRDSRPGSDEKDRLENYLHAEVCAGRMPLPNAQRAIAVNWVQAWQQARLR